jgi:hypothetical protein
MPTAMVDTFLRVDKWSESLVGIVDISIVDMICVCVTTVGIDGITITLVDEDKVCVADVGLSVGNLTTVVVCKVSVVSIIEEVRLADGVCEREIGRHRTAEILADVCDAGTEMESDTASDETAGDEEVLVITADMYDVDDGNDGSD